VYLLGNQGSSMVASATCVGVGEWASTRKNTDVGRVG
jgi:hypothetical protein